jgi:uncharacterized membrane protein YdjX (TVP38/TMEM64 family)
VLSCVYLYGYPKIVLLICIIVFATLGTLLANADAKEHETYFKILTVTLITLSFLFGCYIVLEQTGIIEKFRDPEVLIRFIRGTRHWGVIVFIALVVFQIIFLPVPTAVAAFIGSKLYGPTLGFVYITLGTLIGSLIAFALGKIFGKKLVVWMIGKEKTDKYAELLDRKGRFLFILMMIFPFFPDDVLCMVAGITAMSYGYFTVVICLTRPVMIAFMCYFVEGSIIPFHGWGIPVWISIFVAMILLFILVSRIKKRRSAAKTLPKTPKTDKTKK